jgi:glucose-6-phosphate dehydrogenase assembly protein OpcA
MGESDSDRRDERQNAPPTTLEGPPQPVDIARIEHELSQLWKSAGDGGDQAVTRACALNLVVHVDSEEAAARASETIAHVASHDPHRAIVVIAEPAKRSGMDAWISAHCFLPAPNRPQVCCEQITVSARGDAVEHAPGLVLPLLVADLPVVLWWVGDAPIDSGAFDRFADVADRIILDSSAFADPCERLPVLASRIRGQPRLPAISDLNWARLTSWRELTAQFFDAPEMIAFLGEVRAVRVEYAANPTGSANPAQAALLLGWLGSCLGWRLSSDAAAPLTCSAFTFVSADGEVVEAEIAGVPRPDSQPGSVVGLAIRARGRTAATFTIAAEAGGECVETRAEIEGRSPIGRTICPGPTTVDHLVCQELEFVGRDQVYEEALSLIAARSEPSAEARRAS